MIITDIRVGSQQVYKVYLGNKLIWQRMENIPVFGKAAFETVATGSMTFFTEVIKGAKATSFSNAEAEMVLVPFHITWMKGREESESYAQATAGVILRLLSGGKSTDTTYAKANARFFQRQADSGKAHSFQQGRSGVHFLQVIDHLAKSLNESFGSGKPVICEVIAPPGHALSETEAAAITNALLMTGIQGGGESDTAANGLYIPHNAVQMPGKSKMVSNTRGKADAFYMMPLPAKSQNKVNAIGYGESYHRSFSLAHVRIDTNGVAYSAALIMIGVMGDTADSSDAKAQALAGNTVQSAGKAVSGTEGSLIARRLDMVLIGAKTNTYSLGKLSGKTYRLISRRGKGSAFVYMKASCDLRRETQLRAMVTLTTETNGVMNPWYLPYNNNGILELRQAYEADFTDGILEVR